jgi:hypothetical protein
MVYHLKMLSHYIVWAVISLISIESSSFFTQVLLYYHQQQFIQLEGHSKITTINILKAWLTRHIYMYVKNFMEKVFVFMGAGLIAILNTYALCDYLSVFP